MFKCKVQFAAFKDGTVDMAKAKTLLKAGIKKLAAPANLGQRVPYYLVNDYFTNEAGEPIGDLLCVGIETAMLKHFRAIETKPGKPKLRKSVDPKLASMGEVYVKDENGNSVVCFEPMPACKMKAPVYAKTFKKMKAMFGGRKGIVIMNGQAAEPVAGEPAVTTEPVAGEPAVTTEPVAGEPAVTTEPVAALGLVQLADLITKGFRGSIPQVMNNVKSKAIQADDGATIQEFIEHLKSFMSQFTQAAAPVKEKLKGLMGVIVKQKPAVEQLLQMVTSQQAGTTTAALGMRPELEALLKKAAEAVSYVDKNKTRFQQELEQNAAPAISGGQDFLTMM